VKLPATKGLRQSTNAQLTTDIPENLPAYLAYVDDIRAEDSELGMLILAVWGGLRDRHSPFVGVVFTTPIVFFTHHRLVKRFMVRTSMDAAQAFMKERLAMLSEYGLAAVGPAA
jgi:hypothetical protein